MKIERIDHINIVVEDMEKTIGFYTSIFNFVVKRDSALEGEWFESLTGFRNPINRCVFLELPGENCRIELLQYIEPLGKKWELSHSVNSTGIRHLAFEVDDIFAFVKRLKDEGIVMISEVVSVPLSVLPQGKKLCYIKAPDGVIIELAQYGQN